MRFRLLMPAMLAGLCIISASASAETPNLTPGLWSHTNTMSIDGPIQIPGQTETQQECITQDDIDQGADLLEAPQSCSITRMDISRDNMHYAMTCSEQGMTYTMEGQMTFMGEHMEGQMTGTMDSPMGSMNMKVDTKAERVGECS
ncbi:DUF3617 domain-containing protein [Nitrincola sp.]|uniref:DUF3617 domain-containing protein n=1 Tax=Nitrincola sp. TaxID=1926584 RepID=UPI003A8FCF54